MCNLRGFVLPGYLEDCLAPAIFCPVAFLATVKALLLLILFAFSFSFSSGLSLGSRAGPRLQVLFLLAFVLSFSFSFLPFSFALPLAAFLNPVDLHRFGALVVVPRVPKFAALDVALNHSL